MIDDRQRATTDYKIDGVLLTRLTAVLLLDHAAGPRATRALQAELRGLRSLRARKLIRFNRSNRPTHSIATVRGREIIAALLARQADALVARDVEQAALP